MEDPAVVAARLTQTAKDLADQARTLAKQAIAESADTDNYTAAQFINTFTKSVDLAVKGGLQFTKDVLDQPGPPDPNEEGRKQVADVMETIGRRMVRQAGAVASDTASQMEKTPNSPNLWVRSMVKLANISLLGSIELAETALIGPAKYELPLTLSEIYPAPGAVDRTLTLDADGLRRPGTSDSIPATLVSFRTDTGLAELAGGHLPATANTFRIGVDPRPLISGIYVGTVEVSHIDAAGVMVVDGTVPVEIAI